MSLKELIDNSKTDKDTTHSYLDLYQSLLEKKSETSTLNCFNSCDDLDQMPLHLHVTILKTFAEIFSYCEGHINSN